MARINDNYLKLASGYLFPEIGRRVRAFQDANPKAEIIRLGIGDVVLPIPASIREAMHRAIDELGAEATFRGYGPEQGYDFLRDAIAKHDFEPRGASVSPLPYFSIAAKAAGPNFGLHSITTSTLPSISACVASLVPSMEAMIRSLPGTLPAASIAAMAPMVISSLCE